MIGERQKDEITGGSKEASRTSQCKDKSTAIEGRADRYAKRNHSKDDTKKGVGRRKNKRNPIREIH